MKQDLQSCMHTHCHVATGQCRQLHMGRRHSEEPFFNRPVVILADRNKTDMVSLQAAAVMVEGKMPHVSKDCACVSHRPQRVMHCALLVLCIA
jgi:hypothetical protein